MTTALAPHEIDQAVRWFADARACERRLTAALGFEDWICFNALWSFYRSRSVIEAMARDGLLTLLTPEMQVVAEGGYLTLRPVPGSMADDVPPNWVLALITPANLRTVLTVLNRRLKT